MTDKKPVGDILDALGVELRIEEDALPSTAVVLMTVVEANGSVTVKVGHSDGMHWPEILGMLTGVQAQVQRTLSS